MSLVLGVAGAGKTTALRAVANAYQSAGYRVLGTATSGQAARTLGREAGLDDARTLASLTWRLEHHQLALDDTTVVILDEAGMTDDPALLRLLAACEIARAKVVLVGDDRQLSAVGPGGALGALLDRHGGHAHVLDENLRQHDPAERAALAELRAGDIAAAVAWYVANRRVHPSRDRDEALSRMVDAWAADALAGRDVAMYAWQRRNVDALNILARQRWADKGRLSGPEMEAPGGRRYRAGDQIVTLAPGRDTVTSERGVVLTAGLTEGLIARMDDGRVLRLEGDDLDREHLAHGYAVTVHRAQGATVDVAHRFEDGGGRELAYVAMSRARHGAHAWLVADDIDQARDDLERDWAHEARARWVIDRTAPDPQVARRAERAERAVDRAVIDAQRRALLAVMPPDVTPQLAAARREVTALEQAERDLATGAGRWTGTPVGDAAGELQRVRAGRRQAERFATSDDASRATRRAWRKQARGLADTETRAEQRHDELTAPIRRELAARCTQLAASVATLEQARDQRDQWLDQHPEAARRLARLDLERRTIDAADDRDRALRQSAVQGRRRIASRERDVGIDLGP